MGAKQKCRSVKLEFWLFFVLSLFLAPIYGQEGDLGVEQSPILEINKNLLLVKSDNLQIVVLQFPKNFDSEKEYPLLVVLHGNGGRAKSISSLFLPYANKDVILVFPQGQYPKMAMGSVGYSWYLGTSDRDVWEIADSFSMTNVVEVIRAVNSKYKVEKNYVFGFSQGAALAYTIGFRFPELINGVIAVGGRMPEIDKKGSVITTENIEKARNIRILVSRGKSDELSGTKQYNFQRKFLEKNGFEVLSLEYEGGHYLTNELFDSVLEWIANTNRIDR